MGEDIEAIYAGMDVESKKYMGGVLAAFKALHGDEAVEDVRKIFIAGYGCGSVLGRL